MAIPDYLITHLLQLLSDGLVHDDIAIASKLGLHQSKVWPCIKQLIEYGVAIEAIDRQSFCLCQPMVPLNQQEIIDNCSVQAIAYDVLAVVDSTNNYLKRYWHDNQIVRCCVAEMQTAGRGRMQRRWHAPFGQNICMSLLYPMKQQLNHLSGISLVVALAVAAAIERACSLPSHLIDIKWPNDLRIHGDKLAGILIETQVDNDGGCQVIIGIGVNVNLVDTQPQINQPWTALIKYTQQAIDRNQVIAYIIQQLQIDLVRFYETGFQGFQSAWQQRDELLNQPITLYQASQSFRGIGRGVDQFGFFQLEDDHGKVKSFAAGEVSLKATGLN